MKNKKSGIVYLTIRRNAITGEVCTKKFATDNPDTTTIEQRVNIKKTLINLLKFAKLCKGKESELVEEFLRK